MAPMTTEGDNLQKYSQIILELARQKCHVFQDKS